MEHQRQRFATGTGEWNRPRTLIVSVDAQHRALLSAQSREDTVVVGTPLEMINHLEDADALFTTVVLAGSVLAKRDLAAFLLENYPAVRVVDGRRDLEPDVYLPAFG